LKQKLTEYINTVFYLVVLTAVVIYTFLLEAPTPTTSAVWVYYLTLGGYYGFAVLLASIPLSLFYWSRWTRPVVAAAIWLWCIYLAIDFVVFDIYRFHLDPLLLEMLFLDFRGMGIPASLLALTAIAAIALYVATYGLFFMAQKAGRLQTWIATLVILLVVPAFLLSSVISIWAHRYDREEVTRYTSYLPLYYPVTSYDEGEKISAMFPNWLPAAAGNSSGSEGTSQKIVHYPLADIECNNQTPDSIAMIVLESWQADMLNPEVMPNLWAFSNQAHRFENHLSSGATTIPGLFGLLYGLHPSYYQAFASTAKSNPSQFTERLKAQGYLKQVFTTGSLERFAQRSLFFPNVEDEHYHSGDDDAAMVQQYINDLSQPQRAKQPTFDFLLLTSSHSPYRYPPDYEKFTPVPAISGGFVFDKMADGTPYKNRSRNSLLHLDHLLGQILEQMQLTGALDDTWVVITGDHAEEFNDSELGYWGHGSNFSHWQTHVPMVVSKPGNAGGTHPQVTFHQDVVPTLLKGAAGCDTDVTTYSNGIPLFDEPPPKRSGVLASYQYSAYFINDTIYERHSGKKYAWQDIAKTVREVPTQAVKALWEEENRFYRKPN